eukprot:NODE_1516_length_1311_cov_6.313345_g1503_i0.p1 GENE.NODE_1516_length_1311_cov_6.313345_g1503_i0~~NODE_1516_length_1311_cov_6.313345_g1503_i0.p1  ORF type:complete len:399 (+),score=120.46 NODE_1516_length_1311_cov_6.313345_g1503_i0:80-1198(+)
MEHNQVPWQVQKTVHTVYPSLIQLQQHDYNDVLDQLPAFLAAEIQKCVRTALIRNVPLFKDLPNHCAEGLALVCQHQVVEPHFDIISGESGNNEMFFLAHGVVEVESEHPFTGELERRHIKAGEWFGEAGLMSHALFALRNNEGVFKEYDDDNNGMIDYEEFQQVLERLNMEMVDEVAQSFFNEVDYDNNGFISFKEFQDMVDRFIAEKQGTVVSARTVTVCDLFKLERDYFMMLCDYFPEIRELVGQKRKRKPSMLQRVADVFGSDTTSVGNSSDDEVDQFNTMMTHRSARSLRSHGTMRSGMSPLMAARSNSYRNGSTLTSTSGESSSDDDFGPGSPMHAAIPPHIPSSPSCSVASSVPRPDRDIGDDAV